MPSNLLFDKTVGGVRKSFFVSDEDPLPLGSPVLGEITDTEASDTQFGVALLLKRILTEALNPNLQGSLKAAPSLAAPVVASFTRPADVIAYGANDAVSNSTSAPLPLTLPGMAAYDGGGGYLTKIRAFTDAASFASRLTLHLFNVSPAAINDNEPYTLLWTNRTTKVGRIVLPVFSTEGAGSTAAACVLDTIRHRYFCAEGDSDLYMLLSAPDAFTPASGQNFWFEFSVERDV